MTSTIEALQRLAATGRPADVWSVLITPTAYPGAQLLLPLGPDVPKASGGMAKWNKIPRPRRRMMTEFDTESLLQLTFSVIVDAFPDGNVEPLIRRIRGWGARNELPFEPTTLRLQGPVPYTDLTYVFDDDGIEETDDMTERRDDGVLCRQMLKLTLIEYNAPDLVVQAASPAAAAQARQASDSSTTGSTPAPAPKTYTVKKGETLSAIAAKQLGNANRWQEIANLNGIRDPRKLQIGQVLKLPS